MAGQARPYRAEHVGSFPRPRELIEAREQHAAGKISADALRQSEDAAIRPIIAMQERVGIGALTDGEFRRASWRDAPFEHLDGFTKERNETDFTFHLFDGSTRKAGPVPSVTGKVRRREPMTADHFSQLAAMTKRPIKANLPTPSVTHFFRGRASIDPKIYPDVNALMADVTRAYREETADLAARGCTYLQMDEVPLAVICDPRNRDIVKTRGEDPDRVIDAYIDAINDSIRGRPADMAVAVHMCRGNMGHGMAHGGYEAIAERLFGRLDVDGYLLEYDTPRAGDFAPLRFVPKGKRVVLGLVTSKRGELETTDDLKRRLDDAAKYLPLEQLCLSPQCGFSSTIDGNALTYEQQVSKLRLVVETARQVWGDA
jgi:5-methyltetrahydropteroyltriglutamate--homocysteine methyltransferase